jgi:hypothetical protein
MKLCVTVEGSPQVNALSYSSSSTLPEMSNKSNPVSLLPHHVFVYPPYHRSVRFAGVLSIPLRVHCILCEYKLYVHTYYVCIHSLHACLCRRDCRDACIQGVSNVLEKHQELVPHTKRRRTLHIIVCPQALSVQGTAQ